MVDEVIPQVVKEFGADAAYEIADLHPGRFCAVGGHSPALWQTAGETAAGAFDDDFAAHDVIAAAGSDPSPFESQPVWLDAGDEDPLLPGDEAFAAELEAAGAPITVKYWPGGHESEYWQDHWTSTCASTRARWRTARASRGAARPRSQPRRAPRRRAAMPAGGARP